jgi:hypothetical protein
MTGDDVEVRFFMGTARNSFVDDPQDRPTHGSSRATISGASTIVHRIAAVDHLLVRPTVMI